MIYDQNFIVAGPYTGRRLAEVLPEIGETFLGKAIVERYGYRLPFIIKFLDTAQWLSVQVHPDDEYARKYEANSGWLGKAEVWMVLEAEPDAQIIYGVKRPVSREELRAAALDGSILELLNFVPVKKGDVIYVPPGTIHALGPGLMILEVQQRSDLTYRLYDYNRGRELHLEQALDVAQLIPAKTKKYYFNNNFYFKRDHFFIKHAKFHKPLPNASSFAIVPLDYRCGQVVSAAAAKYLKSGDYVVAGA